MRPTCNVYITDVYSNPRYNKILGHLATEYAAAILPWVLKYFLINSIKLALQLNKTPSIYNG